MKQYIWMAAVAVIVSGNASENPFDLNSNLKKIDQAENTLLGDLDKIAKKQEAEDEFADNEEDLTQEETVADKQEEKRIPQRESVNIETADEKAERLQEEEKKAEQARIIKEKADAEKRARIQKAQEEKKAADALARRKAEKAALEKKLAAEKAAKTVVSSENTVDIDIAKEEAMKAAEAQKRLEEAIKEVDQED